MGSRGVMWRWVASSWQGPGWAIVGSVPCTPQQRSSGVLAPSPNIRTPSMFGLHWDLNQKPSASQLATDWASIMVFKRDRWRNGTSNKGKPLWGDAGAHGGTSEGANIWSSAVVKCSQMCLFKPTAAAVTANLPLASSGSLTPTQQQQPLILFSRDFESATLLLACLLTKESITAVSKHQTGAF